VYQPSKARIRAFRVVDQLRPVRCI
jgi:hypothetical protein